MQLYLTLASRFGSFSQRVALLPQCFLFQSKRMQWGASLWDVGVASNAGWEGKTQTERSQRKVVFIALTTSFSLLPTFLLEGGTWA